jgi:hypothetical protein
LVLIFELEKRASKNQKQNTVTLQRKAEASLGLEGKGREALLTPIAADLTQGSDQ